MSQSSAWLLHCGDSISLAVGDQEMVEVVQGHSSQQVPGLPDYCSRTVQWQDQTIQVLDVAALNSDENLIPQDSYLCILNYQEAPNHTIKQIALRVGDAPERIQVDDSQFCDMPPDLAANLLMQVTLSSFTHNNRTVLVLDIAKLCSAEFRDMVAAV